MASPASGLFWLHFLYSLSSIFYTTWKSFELFWSSKLWPDLSTFALWKDKHRLNLSQRGKLFIFMAGINSLGYFMTTLYVSLNNSNYNFSLYGVFNIHTVVLSQCFKAVSPASQRQQGFLTAGSPGLSTTTTDWCLIRTAGCTVPDDVIETGMVMWCLLIVGLIKFLQFKKAASLRTASNYGAAHTRTHTSENSMIDELKESWPGVFKICSSWYTVDNIDEHQYRCIHFHSLLQIVSSKVNQICTNVPKAWQWMHHR